MVCADSATGNNGGVADDSDALNREELQRYSRQIMLPQLGMAGQQRLHDARVLVVGAGGLGSPALLYLAGAGVGTIGIVDDDVVDATNLQRQVIHTTTDVGRSKVASAAEKVRALNPHVQVVEHDLRLTSANALEVMSGYDLVLDGADNFPTRYLVSDAAELLGLTVVWGAIFQFAGQLAVFDAAAGGPTYRDVFPEPPAPGTVPSCAQGGVVGVLPGMLGAAMAGEAVKQIAGIGRSMVGRLVVLDALDFSWRELEIKPDPTREPITELIDYQAFCGIVPDEAPQTDPDAIPVAEFAEMLQSRAAGDFDFDFIDLREPGEYEIVHIDGARLVPQGRFANGDVELDPDRTVVLTCRTDVRSRQVRDVLVAAGHRSVRYLQGGVMAWVEEREPDKPVY